MENKTSRREFCAHAISFVTIASLIEGCGGGSPTSPGGGGSNATTLTMINASVSGRSVTLNIDAASPLASAGSAAFVQSSAGKFLVARTGQDTFSALTAICTHEQCDVTTFSSSSNRFVCPCHGSQYSTSGSVQNGPATRPLQQFPTQFTNGVLTITV
jgi:Rieske Fe-S protein